MKLILDDTVHFEDIKSTILEGNAEVVEFKHADLTLLLKDLQDLVAWENDIFKQKDTKELTNLIPLNVTFKQLSLDNKIEVLRFILTAEEVVNSNLLLNLFMMVTSNSKYREDSIYDNESIILGKPGANNGLEEFLDAKIALKPELEKFYFEVTKYYLSCLCSVHYKETDIAYDSLVIMPVKYNQIISFLTFEDLSRISRRVKDLKDIDLVPLYNAGSILQALVLNQYPTANFLELFSNLVRNPNE